MPRRRLAIAAIIAGLVVVSAWLLVLRSPPFRITKEAAERIKPGMTLAEVESILGPPRDETDGRFFVIFGSVLPDDYRHWVAKRVAIVISFDAETDAVYNVSCFEEWWFPMATLERIECWLEVYWKRLWP